MKKTHILFIDSGVGGLSTLSETLQLLNADYIYFADTKYAPYGNKSTKFLRSRLNDIICAMKAKYNIQIVVLACNTATTSSIAFLRECHPDLKIVGTEPALKVATDNHFSRPAVIATPQTIRCISPKLQPTFNVISHEFLASLIEENLLSPSYLNGLKLKICIYSIASQTINNDCLVLGCTHYPFIKNKLFKLVHKPILDGNQGVARKISSLTENFSLKSSVKLEISSKNTKELQKYKKILNQILAKQIKL